MYSRAARLSSTTFAQAGAYACPAASRTVQLIHEMILAAARREAKNKYSRRDPEEEWIQAFIFPGLCASASVPRDSPVFSSPVFRRVASPPRRRERFHLAMNFGWRLWTQALTGQTRLPSA
jgi:hypothetical protein